MKQKVSRRDFMKGAAVAAAAGLLAGCSEEGASTSSSSSSSGGSSSGSSSSSSNSTSSSSSSASSASSGPEGNIMWTIKSLEGGNAEIIGYDKTGPKPKGKVIVPEKVAGRTITVMGAALRDDPSITGVVLPDSITEIGSGAFRGCTNLSEINWPKNLAEIKDYAFYGTALKNITIPKSVVVIYYSAFSYSKLQRVRFSGEKIHLKWAFSECKELNDIVLPSEIYTDDGAPLYHTVRMMAEELFENCVALKNVIVPANTKGIRKRAFNGCKALQSVAMPNYLELLGESAFKDCISLPKIVIPDGPTKIEKSTFQGDIRLEKIYIPKTVTSISQSAFQKCNNLKDVYYGGTSADWLNVKIAEDNGGLSVATIHYGASRQDAE